MIEVKARLWRTVGVAALAGVGLGACSPGGEAGEAGQAQHGEAGEAAIGETGGEAGVTAAAHGGGESGGEVGAVDAYAGTAGAERAALRLHHLRGFLLLARELQKAGETDQAAALVGQAKLEIVDAGPGELGSLDASLVQAAADASPDQAAKTIEAALAATEAAAAGLPDDAALVRRLLLLTRGLYGEVVTEAGVDPVEYQHSLGAMLGATSALTRLETTDAAAKVAALSEMARLRTLWPALIAPETPTPAADVAAQIARVELALSRL